MLKTLIRITRPRTGGTQRSTKPPAGETGSAGSGVGSGAPYSARDLGFDAAENPIGLFEPAPAARASAGFRAAQKRRNPISAAASAPIRTTQRQPSTPNGAVGTRT